jgi:hypothetical protein
LHAPVYVWSDYRITPTYTGMPASVSASKTQTAGHLPPVRMCDTIFGVRPNPGQPVDDLAEAISQKSSRGPAEAMLKPYMEQARGGVPPHDEARGRHQITDSIASKQWRLCAANH